ncbi:hypothetical protein BDQ17DRAFT_1360288, partial [Cyathus striatus]
MQTFKPRAPNSIGIMPPFDPKEYVGVDPDFLPDFKMRITWQPSMFVFGIPVEYESLFKLAKDNGFLVLNSTLENPDPEDVKSMDKKKTVQKLHRNLRKELGIRFNPRHSVAYGVRGTVLSFLTSYDETYPLPPAELSELIQDHLNIEEPLMWYLDALNSKWEYGTYGYLVIG